MMQLVADSVWEFSSESFIITSPILKPKDFNLQNIILKVLAFQGKSSVRSQIVLNDKPIEQVNTFKYLGYNINPK
jgi:hypothetical protein